MIVFRNEQNLNAINTADPIFTKSIKNAKLYRAGNAENGFEPRQHKTNKVSMRPAKTQISLGIRLVRSESSLSA